MIDADTSHPLLAGTPAEQSVWMSHGDKVSTSADGLTVLATSKNSELAACAYPARNAFGVQFHPEVHHTRHGTRILENFLFEICRCEKNWNPHGIVDQMVHEIREQVGDGRVICGVSGGVDRQSGFV